MDCVVRRHVEALPAIHTAEFSPSGNLRRNGGPSAESKILVGEWRLRGGLNEDSSETFRASKYNADAHLEDCKPEKQRHCRHSRPREFANAEAHDQQHNKRDARDPARNRGKSSRSYEARTREELGRRIDEGLSRRPKSAIQPIGEIRGCGTYGEGSEKTNDG